MRKVLILALISMLFAATACNKSEETAPASPAASEEASPAASAAAPEASSAASPAEEASPAASPAGS
jgi:hypothetical protein